MPPTRAAPPCAQDDYSAWLLYRNPQISRAAAAQKWCDKTAAEHNRKTKELTAADFDGMAPHRRIDVASGCQAAHARWGCAGGLMGSLG